MIIEAATAADLEAIDEIERHSFPNPWPRATFEAELVHDIARVEVVRRERDRRVIAFCNYWLVAGEVHILAIATHPDHRRGGVGARLLAHMLAEGRRTGCAVATLEVRRGNHAAIALYARAGFTTVHIRERYYQDNHEDALVMTLELGA